MIGAGVAAAVAGGAVLGVGIQKQNAINTGIHDHTVNGANFTSLQNTANAYKTGGAVTLGIGGAALVSGVAVLAWGATHRHSSVAAAASHVGIGVGRGGAMGSLSWTF